MGYTTHTKDIILKHLSEVRSVLDLGSQNIYFGNYDPNKPKFASEWYNSMGIEYDCIDLGGDNNAIKRDLAYPTIFEKQYDLVVDAGTSEHVVQMNGYESTAFHGGHINSIYPKEVVSVKHGYYNCWLNKHNALKLGGVMINENPETGSWPDHGYSYLSIGFYEELVKITDYKIIALGTFAAEGNIKDGWNIFSVLQKMSEKFPSFEEFSTLPIFKR